MMNSILETRSSVDIGLSNISLQIKDDEYFSVYEGLQENDAFELLNNYLKYRTDNGKPEDVRIKHDKNQHIIVINAVLHYIGNEKTT